MLNKKILMPVLAIAAGGAIIFASVSYAKAQGADHFPIVERIAEKFNLNKDEVQDVFDKVHEEHHSQMRQNLEQKLNDAVQKGTITETQKSAIIAKMEEKFQIKLDFKQMSEVEHHQQMQQHHAEFEQWLTDNGLTSEILKEIGVGPFGRGFKHVFKADHPAN